MIWLNGGTGPLIINPCKIILARPHGSAEKTIIMLESGEEILVTESVEQVFELVRQHMNAKETGT